MDAILNTPIDMLQKLSEKISEDEENKMEFEMALRGIKHKKKQKLKPVSFNPDLDNYIQNKISKRS